MLSGLILSLFPGIGLLDRAFEEEGFCIVRGPDVIWGGDVKRFHPPANTFDGIIGGPPCQTFSALVHLVRANGYEPRFGNLIPEFERCVVEAQPTWFLMENVPQAPLPEVEGYIVRDLIFNNRWAPEAPEQNRIRRFSFGTHDGRALEIEGCALEAPRKFVGVTAKNTLDPWALAREQALGPASEYWVPAQNQAVTAVSSGHGTRYRERKTSADCGSLDPTPVKIGGSGKLKESVAACDTSSDGGGRVKQVRYTFAEACELQGLPPDFLVDAPFTAAGKLKAVGNGVPLPTGRAIARAVRRAVEDRP